MKNEKTTITVNWKGLFLENPSLWGILLLVIGIIIAIVTNMVIKGEFQYHATQSGNYPVKILSDFKIFSQRMIISDPVSGHAVEIELPWTCHIISPLEGKTITTKIVVYYREYDQNTYIDMPDIKYQVCKK